VTLLAVVSAQASGVIQRFQYWGTVNQLEKLILYNGWTNGFFAARGSRGLELADCLETVTSEQAIAMIDKRHKDHPEKWSHPITQQVLEVLTVEGGPCAGKIPCLQIQTKSKYAGAVLRVICCTILAINYFHLRFLRDCGFGVHSQAHAHKNNGWGQVLTGMISCSRLP
jgi:hypothetical protein